MNIVKVLVLVVALVGISVCSWGSYGEGWKEGYKAGYCYREFACMAPIPPMAPMPRLGEDSYKDGYNRGFLKGLEDK